MCYHNLIIFTKYYSLISFIFGLATSRNYYWIKLPHYALTPHAECMKKTKVDWIKGMCYHNLIIFTKYYSLISFIFDLATSRNYNVDLLWFHSALMYFWFCNLIFTFRFNTILQYGSLYRIPLKYLFQFYCLDKLVYADRCEKEEPTV